MAFLRALKGLEPGCICELKPGENTLGRNAKVCHIVLQHYAVSREHARIRVTPEGTFIEDLGSRNGVRVNGAMLRPGTAGQRRLLPRDRIEVAAFEFVYHEDASTDVIGLFDDPSTESGILSTVEVASDSSHRLLRKALTPTNLASETADMDTRRTSDFSTQVPETGDRAWSRLESVLGIIEQTGGTIDVNEAPEVILDSLFRTFPQTEAGCVLLRDQSPIGFAPAIVKGNNGGGRSKLRMSQAVLEYVVQNKQAVLSGDARSEAAFALSESAANLRVRSVMCVPLVDLSGEVVGVIELETSKNKTPYTHADLGVLAGVARHLAIVIENAQLHAAMLKAQRAEFEARFRRLIEGSIQGILIHRDFEPLFVNEAWARLHGYTVDEVLEMRSVLPLVAPDDRERVFNLNRARKTDPTASRRGELRGLCKDGTTIWLEEFATVVDWDDGLATQSTVADLTERKNAERHMRASHDELEVRVQERTKELGEANQQLQAEVADRLRAEAELQESFALYHSLVDHIPLCVVRKSVEGKLTFVNRAMCQLFGKTPADFVGKTDYDLFSPEQAEDYRRADEEVIRSKTQVELIESLPLPSGEVLTIHTLKTPIYDIEQRIIGTQLIFWDITAQKRVEEDRNRYAAELERSNRDLEQFAYNVSHDLQSPLRTIASFCQMLHKRCHEQVDEVSNEYLTSAIDGTKRMKRLLDDLLEYARVSTKPRELTQVAMEKVVEAVLSNLAAPIRDCHAVVSHDPLPKVLGDQTQLIQLLQNLIHNALKYRRQTSPRIHVAVEEMNGHWQFSVHDNGEGIDRKQFERVFQIFQRLHSERERPGTGIGLTICKRIVERHGGRIWVDSRPGEGSVFSFTLAKNQPDA